METYLDEYIAAVDIEGDADGPLFTTTGQKTARFIHAPGCVPDDSAAGKGGRHQTKIGNHTFRTNGVTAYPKNGGMWGMRSKSPIIHRRARRSSTIGGVTTFRSMKSRRSGFELRAMERSPSV